MTLRREDTIQALLYGVPDKEVARALFELIYDNQAVDNISLKISLPIARRLLESVPSLSGMELYEKIISDLNTHYHTFGSDPDIEAEGMAKMADEIFYRITYGKKPSTYVEDHNLREQKPAVKAAWEQYMFVKELSENQEDI